MDRTTTVGYVLIFILFVAFFYFNQENVEELEAQEARSADTTIVAQTPDTSQQVSLDTVSLDTQENAIAEQKIEEQIITLSTDKLKVDFTNVGGIPAQVTLNGYKRYDSSDLVLFTEDQHKFNYTIPKANGTTLKTSDLEFKVKDQTEKSIRYVADLGNGAQITQEYTLQDDSYKIDYNVWFDNIDRIIAPNNPYAVLNWTSEIQSQEKTIDDEAQVTTVYYKYLGDDDIDNLSETKADEETLNGSLKWISFKQKFFNQTLIHKDAFQDEGIQVETKEATSEDYVKDLAASIYFPIESSRQAEEMTWFFGPNHYQTLKKEGIGLQKMIPLGWGIFGWVNKLLVIPVFNWLEQYFDSYGVIILLLTLIIKLLLIVPMYRVYKSSAKMRLLKPELDEIKERTGGDMQKMQQEQMKLYKQAGVSPLGGCLPQLVQIPILFAMFRFFPASIELRQERLWWAEDLSSYDSIYDFPNGFEIPFYGDHISLFTLMMTAVTLIYTVTNSQSSGQLAGPMKTVIYIMPIMFLGFFNNYAAALSFYYFLSTCITIIQNFIIRKFVIDEDKLHAQLQQNKKKKVKVKKSGLQKRLEKMAEKRGIDPYSGKPKNTGNRKR
jgi:YidC/Oxa1 family membrane protein insertase